jgi:phage terminase small subunit
MPTKTGALTRQEAAFAGYFAHTGDDVYAAKMAGYSHPHQRAAAKRADPVMAEVVRKEQARRLNTELLPLSLNLLEKVLTDEQEATRNRITAAQTVLKYSLGLTGDGADAKEPHEMTTDELQARIDALRRVQADKARPVIDAEPVQDQGVFD